MLRFPSIGQMVWVQGETDEDFVPIKLITIDHLYWDDTEDLQGWNVICGDEEYYLETCIELEYPISAN